MSKRAAKSFPAQSLARGLEVFEFIAFSQRAVRLKDVSEAFELDMASAHRILKTLEQLGYVSRLSIGKAYGPGDKVQALARSFSTTDRMVKLLHPIVVELAETTGRIAHTAIRQDNHAILAEVAIGSNAKVTIRQAPGDADELFCSAVGKSLLANVPKFEQNALLKSLKFTPHTENTITTMSALKRELATVKKTGVAFDNCEGDPQICCIGSPIFGKDGMALAAIGISMLSTSLSGPIFDEKVSIEQVKEASKRASDLVQAHSKELFLLAE